MEARSSILIYDEDEATRQLLTDILSPDYEILATADASQPLEFFSRPIDLVIVDLHLPELLALDFIRTVRTTPHLATLPMIALADSEPLRQTVVGQVQGILPKPFTLSQLTRLVADMIQCAKQRGRGPAITP